MSPLVIAALACAVAATSDVRIHTRDVASHVRACASSDRVACGRLADTLETLFAGTNDADRELGRKLAAAAVRVVSARGDATVIGKATRACSSNDADACDAICRVLVGLFTGADARLDASADRVLARAFASRMSALAAQAYARAR